MLSLSEMAERFEAENRAARDVLIAAFAHNLRGFAERDQFDPEAVRQKSVAAHLAAIKRRNRMRKLATIGTESRQAALRERDAEIRLAFSKLPERVKKWGAPAALERKFSNDGWRVSGGKPLSSAQIRRIIK
jgi:hypothetical protein